MESNQENKLVVSYSNGSGMKFEAMTCADGWQVAVMKYDEINRRYKCVDVGSCDSEEQARSWAWAMSMPGGYKLRGA